MIRRSKLLVAPVVIGVSAVIGLGYAGMIESLVSPDQLPASPAVGALAIFAVVGLGWLASRYLDTRAWKEMGRNVGLTAGGGPQFAGGPAEKSDKPTLTGIVNGRAIRARTYTTGGRNDSNKTYTVVEAELDTPVDWHASFGTPRTEQGAADHSVDAATMQSIDGVGVRGEVPEDAARDVLTRDVRDAVASVAGEVSVGNVVDNLVGDMLTQLDGDAGGVAGAIAEGMLSAGGRGDDGPSRVVEHRAEGLLTDEQVLRRRIDAVTTVADAVDRSGAAATQPTAARE